MNFKRIVPSSIFQDWVRKEEISQQVKKFFKFIKNIARTFWSVVAYHQIGLRNNLP
jgi:hypothetical protein